MTAPPAPSGPERAVSAVVGRLSAGGSAVVTGPAGIGKSRTLRWAADELRASGRQVLGIRATGSLAAVPFGPLLPLLTLPHPPTPDDRTGTALAVLSLLLGPGDAVLLVDDAHLLDAASAGIVHQVAAAGSAVGVAVRDGEPLPDAVARLVPDLGAEEVGVPRLEEHETAGLLQALLGGEVDDRFIRVVHRRSTGLPLAVQALARVARKVGAVSVVDGVWRLRGEIPAADELAALMRDVTASLDEPARRAAELVALAESLSEAQLQALGVGEGAERAEGHGVLRVAQTGEVVPAHPLLLDALLAELPGLRRRRHLAALLDVVQEGGTPASRVRRTDWRLELGRPVQPDELLRLSAATASGDPDRAARYARSAVDAGGGVPALLRLAEVLAHLHRAEEAEAVLAAIDSSALDPPSVIAAELTRAYLLIFALARPDDGLQALDALPDLPMVSALRSTAHFFAGRIERAGTAARALAVQTDLPVDARAHAALLHATALVAVGDERGLREWSPTASALVDEADVAIPEGRASLRLLEGLCIVRVRLDVDEVDRLASAGYRAALEGGEDGERAQWSNQLGIAELLRGRPDLALEHLRKAAHGRGRWSATMIGLVRGWLIRALALSGDLHEAHEAIEQVRALRVYPTMRIEVALGEAETTACDRDLRGAGRIAEAAARTDPGGGADGWYAAVRYGRSGAATEFLRAADRYAGPGRAAQRTHARAVLTRDPEALETAAGALRSAGLGWFAVDAMAHAAHAFSQRDPAAAAPMERLRDLAAHYPSLHSPVVAALQAPVLTERESEIARLVADGATAKQIADRLHIGVRTVETHIAHAYRKLGVGNREELRGVLRAG